MNQIENHPSRNRSRLVILTIIIVLAFIILVIAFNLGHVKEQTGINFISLIPAAFLSGVLSFLSPCSLPILPAYFAYSFQSSKQSIVLVTVAFFLGLATTMTILGASITAVGRILVSNISTISFIGGIIIIIFGVLSIFGKGFTGVNFQDRPERTVAGSYIYGATFAIGWTACIGPILGAILTLLVTQGTGIFQGAFLSFVYSLGLGFPLIIISTFFSRLGNGSRLWQLIRGRGFDLKIGSHILSMHTTGIISGILLIGIGMLLLSGQLTYITQLATTSPISSWVVAMDEKIRLLFKLR